MEKTAHIKAVLFDLDGTLLDTETISDLALFASLPIAPEKTTAIPWELKKQILGLRGAEWGPIVLEYVRETWDLPPSDLPTVDELWSAREANGIRLSQQVEACPGALPLVQELSAAGIPMALATSSRKESVNQKRIHHHTMFQHFSAIVCGDHAAVRNGKPAPDIYLEAARQLGVDPQECLVFEDAMSGVRAGKTAGCYVVAVPDSRFDKDEKAKFAVEADIVLDDLWQFSGESFGINIRMHEPE